MPELDHLESALGHHFKNRKLLFRALTHSSRVHEIQATEPSGSDADNEQMEFLGDSVLGFLISESLVQRFPSYPEGRLSKLKAHLVSAAHLYEVAQALELGQYLILGRGAGRGEERRPSQADAAGRLPGGSDCRLVSGWRCRGDAQSGESLGDRRPRSPRSPSVSPGAGRENPGSADCRFQERPAGARASAEAAAASLRDCERARSGTLQDVHNRG